MNFADLPAEGAASPDLAAEAHAIWAEEARKCGIDLSRFEPAAPLAARAAWAASAGLALAVVYSRYSSQRQGSTRDQVRANVIHAARHGVYPPPELLCIDEAVKGRRQKRPGLDRARAILAARLAQAFIVYKLSRLMRMAHKALEFLRETLVDKGIRGMTAADGIDTADKRVWKFQTAIKGTMDEEALDVIGEHVREGLVGLHLRGWVTGALPVGYMPKELPDAPRTRRNLPRTVPSVDPSVAAMIVAHFTRAAEGADLTAGWRKWRADGGPADPRSTSKAMSYPAYVRMLRREAYTGRWPFCRKRNSWSGRGELTQVKQPPEEVRTFVCEELRIISDELFARVQARLDAQALGPRPRASKPAHTLWDLVIGEFACAHCRGTRFHMAGCKGQYMRCKNPDCPARAMVHRFRAVEAVLKKMTALLTAEGFPELVLESFADLSALDHDALDDRINSLHREQRTRAARIADLEDLLGTGDEEQRRKRKEQIKALSTQQAATAAELAGLQRRAKGGTDVTVTREKVVAQLQDILSLLNEAAAGLLGQDVVSKAADLFRRLVGGQVLVRAIRRGGRKDFHVTGTFIPNLIGTLRTALGADPAAKTVPPVAVELVRPPFVDQIAEEVHRLYDTERKGFRVINQLLEAKYARKIGTGNCCAARRRYFESRGLPVPPARSDKGGRRRKAG